MTFSLPVVCPFKTSLCVRSKRPKVCRLHAGTHGDVLNVHTEAFLNLHTGGFSACHGTHHTTATATTTHTHDNDNDTQRHQLTNLRLNPVQREKTHQVKTRQ